MLYLFRHSSLSLSLLAVLVHHPCQYHLHSSCPLLLSPSFLAFSSSLTAPPSLSFFSLLVLFYSPSLALFSRSSLTLRFAGNLFLSIRHSRHSHFSFFFFTFVLSYGPRLYRSSIILPSPFSFFTFHYYPPRSFPLPSLTPPPLLVAIICYSPCPPFLSITTILLSSLFSTWPHSPILPSSPSPPPPSSRLHLAPSLLSPMGPLRRGREFSQDPGGSHEAQRSPCSMRHGRAPHTPGRCRGEGVAAGKLGCGMCGVGRWARDRQVVG